MPTLDIQDPLPAYAGNRGETPPDYSKLKALVQSRKFWTASIGAAVSVFLYANGELSAETFVDAVTLIAGIYMGAVALEDGLRGLVTIWTKA